MQLLRGFCAVAVVALVGVGLSRQPSPTPTRPHERAAVATTRGSHNDLAAVLGGARTCAQGDSLATPLVPEHCRRWAPPSGGVNVVVLGRQTDPLRALAGVWRLAHGQWLVAEAQLLAPGCAGWTPSGMQFEDRIDRVTRRHIKVVVADCAFPGYRAAVAEAHTDLYEMRRCGGDHMVDMNAARDALVARLATLPGATVKYLTARGPAAIVDGCRTTTVDDGRIAVVTLG